MQGKKQGATIEKKTFTKRDNFSKIKRGGMKLLTLILTISLVVIFCAQSEAADWIWLTRNLSGTVIYYVDNEGTHYEDDRVTFWDKRVVSDDPDYKEIRGYNEVNCKENTYRTLQIIGYDKSGKSSAYQDSGQWQHIDATSAIAVYYGYLCKK